MEKKPHHADERAKPHTREMKSLSRLVVTGVPTKEGETERSICTAGRAAGNKTEETLFPSNPISSLPTLSSPHQ